MKTTKYQTSNGEIITFDSKGNVFVGVRCINSHVWDDTSLQERAMELEEEVAEEYPEYCPKKVEITGHVPEFSFQDPDTGEVIYVNTGHPAK